MPADIKVKCNGTNGNKPIGNPDGKIIFGTSGNCNFTSFEFPDYVPPGPTLPPGFSNRVPKSGGGKTISFDYDGTPPIPSVGYKFSYFTDAPPEGNGTGVIKP